MLRDEKAGVCSIHREPFVSQLSAVPGSGVSNNMTSTFGKDVLRQLGFSEKEFEMISMLSKLVGPVSAGQPLDLDAIQKGLEGRLMKLKQIRAEGKTANYLEAIAEHQRASQPFLNFKGAITQLRTHVQDSAGAHLETIRELLVEFERESKKRDTRAINTLVKKWKDAGPLTDEDTAELINFVYSPLERTQFFSKERAVEGITKARREGCYLPVLSPHSVTFGEELKLAHWIVGTENPEVIVQFFLYINRASAEESSKATTFALAVRQIGQALRDYVQLLHVKLALAKAFQLNPEDENWTPVMDQLLEKFDAIAILAEALGLEYSIEYESFVGYFDVVSVRRGLYSSVNTIFSSHDCIEHWWPLHWLGVKNAEELKTKNSLVRETVMLMPAKEIKYRLEMLLAKQTARANLDSTLENEWIAVDTWV